MSTVLVTGSSGFIGSHLVARLKEVGYNVIPFDLDCGCNLKRPLCGFVDSNVDVIYHLGAMSLLSCRLSPDEAIDVNVRGTLNVLEFARESGARVVLTSASSVYGTPSLTPVIEDSILDPTSLYGATKVCSEMLTRVYGKLHGVPYVVFRLAGVYGPGQVNGVIPAFLRSVLVGSTVGITGDGSQTRDFVFIDDVIHFLVRAMDNSITGTFNLATGVNTSINDLLDAIMLVTGTSVPVEYIRSDADERSLRNISIDRLRAVFGEVPSTSLRDGLRKTWEAFR